MNAKLLNLIWQANQDLVFGEVGQVVTAAENAIQAEAWKLRRAKAAATQMPVPILMLHALELADRELSKMGCECDCEDLPTSCPVCAVKQAIKAATASEVVK